MNKNNLYYIKELKIRLIYSLIIFFIFFIISYIYREELYYIISRPLLESFDKNNINNNIIYTSLTEGFFTYIKLSFIFALILSIFFIFMEIYLFLSPALYKNEKLLFIAIFSSSFLLFILSIILSYQFFFPIIFDFFINFTSNSDINIDLMPKISEYLSLFLKMIFAFTFTFQLPILLTFLIKINLITIKSLKKNRKYYIIIIFIIAAIITPPDILTQIIIASIMIILYELVILINYKSK